MKSSLNIFWFRRDLRLTDNAGFFQALKGDLPVLPIFIFDRNILDQLDNKRDARVEFIYGTIQAMQSELSGFQSGLAVYYGNPLEIFSSLLDEFHIDKVFANEDYEPYASERDGAITSHLLKSNTKFETFKDQVIFSKDEVLKSDGTPYTVFTPYSKKWKNLLSEHLSISLKSYPLEKYYHNLYQHRVNPMPTMNSMGFSPSGKKIPCPLPDPDLIKNYAVQRDYPALDATSHLGIHLRFGTVSIRQLTKLADKLSEIFLNELIWRDFYHMILWHFPKVGKGHAFKEAYEKIPWRNNEKDFACWCEGKTGYPLVDAGMRQLNETGFMHNRVRMVTASFLTKHLLIDWRWGEAYFAGCLLDFDLASNNGGWQWAAGSGCDAAPYFRIFNPSIQQKKFDPAGNYIKKWLPDIQELNYPKPIVEHAFARERAIRVYKEALAEGR